MKSKAKQGLRPTLNSERSPSVHYSNWKETMLLMKQLSTLHRTERGLLHRITVDQKVIFRRFQVKLQRSKVAHARLQGNRELEKELRDAGMRRLHSESHLGHCGDDDFLSKLERRPYGVETDAKGSLGSIASQKKLKPIPELLENDVPVTDDDMKNLVRSVINDQPISNTAHNLRSLSALGQILQTSDIATRLPDLDTSYGNTDRTKSANDVIDSSYKVRNVNDPRQSPDSEGSTEDGQSGNNTPDDNDNLQNIDMSKKELSLNIILDTQRNSSKTGRHVKGMRNKTLPALKTKEEQFAKDPSSNEISIVDSAVKRKPIATSLSSFSNNTKSNALFDNTDGMNNSSNRLGRELQIKSGRTSPSHSVGRSLTPLHDKEMNGHMTNGVRRKKSSIFEEYKKPDFRKQRLAIAKTVDHSDQVRSFCEALSAFGPGVPDFDYYASKMQADAKSQVKSELVNTAPGTPEAIYRKHTGDQTIKCITMPRLKLWAADDVSDGYDDFYQQARFDSLVLNSDQSQRSLDGESENG